MISIIKIIGTYSNLFHVSDWLPTIIHAITDNNNSFSNNIIDGLLINDNI